MRRFIPLLLLLLSTQVAHAKDPTDAPGCKDPPPFNRLQGTFIYGCDKKSFDSYTFILGKDQKEAVEGRFVKVRYHTLPSRGERPSELQIRRNFENAVTQSGGTVVLSERGRSTMKLVQGGAELWIEVRGDNNGEYSLLVVEKQAMAQDVVADAAAFAKDLAATGHSAVYGILFDTGKADLKPESTQAIAEIAKLLAADPKLELYVVGHTDTVGNVDANLKLSRDRAAAVIAELVRAHKIATSRLQPFGNGPYAPVATNDSEDGRAKNRRVELVRR